MSERRALLLELLRRPYQAGASGPEAFDCFGLAQYVQAVFFNRVITRDPEGMLKARRDWAQAHVPADGALVLMRGGDAHVGVWLAAEGGVLHAVEGHGVLFDAPAALVFSGYGEPRYYNPRCSPAEH